MPKQKRHRGAKTAFKITGTGKILRRRAMRSHLLGKKSPKRKRSFRRLVEVARADRAQVKKMLGGR